MAIPDSIGGVGVVAESAAPKRLHKTRPAGTPCMVCGAWITANPWYSIEFDHEWIGVDEPSFAYFCGTKCMRAAAAELR
ncbi:MAG: hypothetical protein WDA28_13115 [Castellaniella sp.]